MVDVGALMMMMKRVREMRDDVDRTQVVTREVVSE